MKHKTYVKVPPLKGNLMNEVTPMQLTQEQESLMSAYASVQMESAAIDMLSGQYAQAAIQQDKQKKKKCVDLIVERARVLLESAEKLQAAEQALKSVYKQA